MGWLDYLRKRGRRREVEERERPVQSARPPTGFLSWAMLQDPEGVPVPCMLRRMMAADAMTLSSWPEPTYFDWTGLLAGRASGRQTRAGVDYDKPVRLQVVETFPSADGPAEIAGAIALCDRPKDRAGALELAYLERAPGLALKGFGTAALAFALLEARDRGLELFLDALLKSQSESFYAAHGLVAIDGTPWPTVTVRMAFPNRAAEDRFLRTVRDLALIP